MTISDHVFFHFKALVVRSTMQFFACNFIFPFPPSLKNIDVGEQIERQSLYFYSCTHLGANTGVSGCS